MTKTTEYAEDKVRKAARKLGRRGLIRPLVVCNETGLAVSTVMRYLNKMAAERVLVRDNNAFILAGVKHASN